MQTGITLRDLVNAIPYVAIQQGLLTVEKTNKKNIFSGRILEIEGLGDLKIEQAFELTDASAERSSNGCTIKLNQAPVAEYLQCYYQLLIIRVHPATFASLEYDARWFSCLRNPFQSLMTLTADNNAEYAATIEINLDDIKEPILACPNDPDDVKFDTHLLF
jgi:aconitate hydratase 2/2-methylisocitrate dehydratase